MSRALAGDEVRLYAEACGISRQAARNRIKRGHASWTEWQANHEREAPAAPVQTLGESVLDRYTAMAERAHQQLLHAQAHVDNLLQGGKAEELRIYVQAVESLTDLYNDAQQKKRAAEVMEGLLLPAEVIDEYKQAFYPKIAASLQELGQAVESLLPQHMRADFASAWEQCLPGHFATLQEAEAGIEGVTLAAVEAGRKLLKKQRKTEL